MKLKRLELIKSSLAVLLLAAWPGGALKGTPGQEVHLQSYKFGLKGRIRITIAIAAFLDTFAHGSRPGRHFRSHPKIYSKFGTHVFI